MSATDSVNINNEDFLKEILIVCPRCKVNKNLKIPAKVVNLSKQLTTISIPSGLCCDHSFQAFVDKNFIVRGYQNVDFEFSKMELFESSGTSLEEKGTTEDEVKDLS